MVVQVFLPCHYGNKLSVASEEISMSLFHSNWIAKDVNFKKAQKILHENSKKSIKIYAFASISIDNNTFLTIYNRAYSLLNLFRSIR